jgi:hypothetical protein
MSKTAIIMAIIALSLLSCDSNSRTKSDRGQNEPIAVTLRVGEHRNIELPIEAGSTYAVTSASGNNRSVAAVSSAIDTNVSASGAVSFSIRDVSPSARPVLRLIGVRGGVESVVVQSIDAISQKIVEKTVDLQITVIANADNDIIDGNPIDSNGSGGGGGGGGNNPNPPINPIPDPPSPPSSGPEYDPDACNGAKFTYVEDVYNDIEGHYGPDGAVYLQSWMNGNVNSTVRLYYPGPTNSTDAFADLGRYRFTTQSGVLIDFSVSLRQHLFGTVNKYFYVMSNNYCLRGNIPSSFMTPPEKTLTWVTQASI